MIGVVEKYDGQVLQIRLGPPPANILSGQAMREISSLLEKEAGNPHRKLIVLTGEGVHFSYGASVEEHAPALVGGMLPGFHQLIGQVIEHPVPTLARISGLCLGGGFELAMACTFLFADEKAKCAIPEIQLGVFPPVAAALLPVLTTPVFASRMIMTGDKLTASELFQAGLLTKIAEGGSLDQSISEFIESRILSKSASSLRIANQASRKFLVECYRAAITELEKLYLGELMSTRDAVEGITAFLEKRSPKWVDA